MATPLRALLVEDSEDDAELLLRQLRRGGYEPTHARVDTPEAMSAELAGRPWDIVFSDYSMPHFNAFDALALIKNTGLDLPFIIVSGTISEDRAVIAMRAGAHDYVLKDNLNRLVPAVERELREAQMRQERRTAEEAVHRLAYTDPVTGMPNRARFIEYAQQTIAAARDNSRLPALLIVDIDRFREVNNTLGRRRGDDLLRQVGLRLRGVLPAVDVVARLGGDEFGILLPQGDDVTEVIRNLTGFLDAPFMIGGIPIAVEVSIGVALAPDHAADVDTLLQWADIALFRAKRTATRYAIYAPELNRHSPERLGLMAELRHAVEQRRLMLHFQPKMAIKTGRIVATEALVRWPHPSRGLLMPDEFIGAAELTGIIGPLTRWVLYEALNRCHTMHRQGTRLRVSVNLSARSLHAPDLLEMIEGALTDTGAEPERLMLEVTESAIMLSPERAAETLTILSRIGVGISIDDFGTGYTSLAILKRLPIDEIKIDKSFVMGMLADKKDAVIVRAVIELGHNLGLSVVAEGVETQETLDALADLGCDEAQGYFICKPQACEPLKNWLLTSPWKLEATA
jgi:diguanylate cyclase